MNKKIIIWLATILSLGLIVLAYVYYSRFNADSATTFTIPEGWSTYNGYDLSRMNTVDLVEKGVQIISFNDPSKQDGKWTIWAKECQSGQVGENYSCASNIKLHSNLGYFLKNPEGSLTIKGSSSNNQSPSSAIVANSGWHIVSWPQEKASSLDLLKNLHFKSKNGGEKISLDQAID